MTFQGSITKVGVYIDVANIYRNGGQKMRYDVLREFACRDSAEPVRLNAYVSFDADRAETDREYGQRARGFHSVLRDLGYKVIVKRVRWYADESGNRVAKANADLDLAVDALLQSENLDRVLLASGDGDFVRVVRALQNKGCRVEALALDNVSTDLRQEADSFMSGYLVPNLIPMQKERAVAWGGPGSRVRGWCYWHHATQSYGFLRYLREIGPGLWLTDTRHPDSPYGTAFFHDSDLPRGASAEDLPSRQLIFEFDLLESERGNGMQATDIALVSRS
jgi:uncharacterized LabA/DUF88 family protein